MSYRTYATHTRRTVRRRRNTATEEEEAQRLDKNDPATLREGLNNPALPLAQRQAMAQQLGQTAGNQALKKAVIQRDPEVDAISGVGAIPEYPKVVTIKGEKVVINSAMEHLHAMRIIMSMPVLYGIEVSSLKGVAAVRDNYTSAPQAVRDAIAVADWQFKELAAIERAVKHFGPLLGMARANSDRAGTDQEVTSVSKVNNSIDEDTATGVVDPDTYGEYYKSSKNFGMYNPGTDLASDFPDNAKQLEGTAVHELAHGLMKYALSDFIAEMDFWTDGTTKSGIADAEAPITPYGKKSASEDLSEAVMYYFVERATLQTKCPKRDEFIHRAVLNWTPEGRAVLKVADVINDLLPKIKEMIPIFAAEGA